MKSNEYFYTLVVLVVMALSTTGLRFIARKATRGRFGADDAFILGASVVLVGLLINSGIMYVQARMGTPMGTLKREDPGLIELFMKCFYASSILYFLCMLPVKLSILSLYLRIWSAFKGVVLATKIAIGVTIAWFLGGVLPTTISCLPHGHTAWDLKPPPTQCLNMGMFFRAITISNFITDFIVLIIPLFAIRKLKLNRSKKFAVAALFLMGSLACMCELLRIIYQEKFKHADLSANAADCIFWTIAEPAIAVMAANLPCLKPLVPEHSPLGRLSGIFSSANRGSRSSRARKPSGDMSNSSGSGSNGAKSWFSSSKKSMLSSTSRTLGSDEEDAIPLTDRHHKRQLSHQLSQQLSNPTLNNTHHQFTSQYPSHVADAYPNPHPDPYTNPYPITNSARTSGGSTTGPTTGNAGNGASTNNLNRTPSTVGMRDQHSRAHNPYLTQIDNTCWSDNRRENHDDDAAMRIPRTLSSPLPAVVSVSSNGLSGAGRRGDSSAEEMGRERLGSLGGAAGSAAPPGGILVKQEFAITSDDRRDFEAGEFEELNSGMGGRAGRSRKGSRT